MKPKGFGPAPAEQPGRQLLQLLKTAQRHQQAGRLAEAEAVYGQVLDTHPDQPDALHNLGLVTYLQGNPFTAELPLRRLLAQQPRNAEAHSNLGAVLEAQGRSVEAEASCRQALVLKSTQPETYNGLGNALMSQGQLDAALASYRQALALKPDYAEAYSNQGNVLLELGQYTAALNAYQQALQLQPGLADAHANQAYVYLLLGHFEAGWHKYEWRWRTGHARGRTFTQPTWDGSDPSGKTLLLHAEQGFGDTIQFVRYISRLRARGATIFVLCRLQERRLLRTCAGIDTLVVQNEPLPEFDAHAPLASLPGLMGTELATIPADVPYLHAPATCTLSEALQQQLQSTDGFKIGLVWSATRLRYADRKRGFLLHLWQALFALPGIYWFSLYKGEQRHELEPYPQVIDVGTQCSDFADTAWAISRLDLVISVDTAVAHLAGALGKPTWVLLPFVPDWRWLLEREDSPWYPSVRLFRQPAPGDWHSVIARVVEGLQKLAGPGQVFVPRPDNAARSVLEPASELSLVIGRASQLATQHQEAGRPRQAGAIYDWILQVQPDHGDALNNLGMLVYELGNGAAAVPLLRRAAALRPKDAYLQFNLAQVLQAVGDADEAQICCMHAVTLEPEFAEAFNTLGNLQAAQGQWLAAEMNYRRALALRPDFAGTCNNLGNVLQQLGHYDEALTCYQQALVQKPDLADAHYNLSVSYLLMGRFELGWQTYEWRWPSAGVQPRHSGATWDGTDPTGKTVLLWAEQGYGDAIQFVRYAGLVKAQGARILLECRPAERRLFESCPGIDRLVLAGKTPPIYDVQVPLMSLPRLLNTTLDTIPAQPYLSAPAVCRLPKALQQLLLETSGLKVGLVWAATVERFEDRKRCCPLPIWEPLLAMAGVSWFSLYQGEQRYELEPYPQVTDVGTQCSDFADTAWAISRLDLVISVDTAVAHLAGALGKPTWVLLPFVPDWRWLLEREDSPWYPSVRLFRQPVLGDWHSVIDQVRTALNAHPHWSRRVGTPQQ